MTREEEISEAAAKYCQDNIPSLQDMHLTISTAFEAGAEYVDRRHNNIWHSVTDGDLPKEAKGDVDNMAFVVITKSGDKDLAFYSYWDDKENEGRFEFFNDCELLLDVKFWMEIPALQEEKSIK